VSNALKFTQKGQISLKCDFDLEKKQLIFNVKDTGLGIKKNDQQKLFKMFGKL
jgi:signal transduction histidine kinase